jgi:hypothetical protein
VATSTGIVLSGGRGVVAALANATARPPPSLSSAGTILQGVLAPDSILFTVCHSGMSKLLLRDIRDVARAVSRSRRELHTGMQQNRTIRLLTSPLHTKSLTVIAMASSLRTSSPTAAPLDSVRHIPPILPHTLKRDPLMRVM